MCDLVGYLDKQYYFPNDIVNVHLSFLKNKFLVFYDPVNWYKNQLVELQIIENNKLKVNLKQINSTPGIRYFEKIEVISGHIYELTIMSESFLNDECILFPFIRGYDSEKNIISSILWIDNLDNVVSNLEINNIKDTNNAKIKIKIPENIYYIDLFVLTKNQNVDDYFLIESIEFSENVNHHHNKKKNVFFDIYNKKKDNVFSFMSMINENIQIYKTNDFATGLKWNVSCRFVIPNYLKSDLYILKISYCSSEFYIPLIIESKLRKNNLLVLINTNTWNAYNSHAFSDGIISAYRYTSDATDKYKTSYKNENNLPRTNSSMLSFKRINFIISNELRYYMTRDVINSKVRMHLIYSELLCLNFLEHHKIKYDVICDYSMDINKQKILDYDIFMIQSHAEYWTKNQLINLNLLKKNNKKIISLGGNIIYWKVIIKNDAMEIKKDHSKHDIDGSCGGLWINLKHDIEPYDITHEIMGTYYNGAYTANDEQVNYPYKILNKDHFIFTNIALDEYDQIGFNNIILGNGPSGWELDTIVSNYYEKFIVAKGQNPENKGGDMIFYEDNIYKFFSCGSMTYCGSLLVDENIAKFTLNIINYFLLPDHITATKTNEQKKEILKNLHN